MDAEFQSLMLRVRQGDADAAAQLVREFEPAVRVAVRVRLTEPTLRSQFDSMDICQSVLASFFFRIAHGELDIRHPAQLVALLTKMARNKLAWKARYSRRQRRDVGRMTEENPTVVAKLLSTTPGPARQAEGRELLQRTWQEMDASMRQIASRRLDGQSWEEIASALGGTRDARRKQYQRGLQSIARSLGIDDDPTSSVG